MALAALTAPTLASARTACDQRAHDRKVTGAVLGAVGGALIGNAVADKNGAIIGGLGGAVVGNQLARVKCDTGRSYTRASNRTAPSRNSAYRQVSYDQCRNESRPYYDERGQLTYQQIRVCGQ
ncbi:glycine zipper 2TM domain-containing protein [Phenylobacterium sp.]|uniref:YMGG-like glycine zipper-containing protein n=1 Tax=Phenylobacterium sp. TaxID=1871053 RepID=UPI002725EFCA|nr:glycine zipper 2TM domain-containing protein [Phenylobacterium sp.]MDO8378817.1 glycine zipper 2TM domain-containing protein [Phenylobacterium sp.]